MTRALLLSGSVVAPPALVTAPSIVHHALFPCAAWSPPRPGSGNRTPPHAFNDVHAGRFIAFRTSEAVVASSLPALRCAAAHEQESASRALSAASQPTSSRSTCFASASESSRTDSRRRVSPTPAFWPRTSQLEPPPWARPRQSGFPGTALTWDVRSCSCCASRRVASHSHDPTGIARHRPRYTRQAPSAGSSWLPSSSPRLPRRHGR